MLKIIILAAGNSKRMLSKKTKVLHTIAGIPMLNRLINTVNSLNPNNIFIIHNSSNINELKQNVDSDNVSWVLQEKQLGTGNAAACCLELINGEDDILILSGDQPLVKKDTLLEMVAEHQKSQHSLVATADVDSSFGYGRVVIQEDFVAKIIEEKDASDSEKSISKINLGFYLLKAHLLQDHVKQLSNNNNSKEYYLTDIISISFKNKSPFKSFNVTNPLEAQGVNTISQLVFLERKWQQERANYFLKLGVRIADPASFYLRTDDIVIGQDVFIDINVVLEGRIVIEDNVVIGANCVIKDSVIKKNSVINPMTMIDGSQIGESNSIGPFSNLRNGNKFSNKVKIGNFVEVKNSSINDQTKASHLSYLGDSVIGSKVNIGAGTITCNYDGRNKHKTIIGDFSFIGSGSQLIAPVNIGSKVTIGAGSTIVKDVDSNNLSLSRVDQKNIPKKPKKL